MVGARRCLLRGRRRRGLRAGQGPPRGPGQAARVELGRAGGAQRPRHSAMARPRGLRHTRLAEASGLHRGGAARPRPPPPQRLAPAALNDGAGPRRRPPDSSWQTGRTTGSGPPAAPARPRLVPGWPRALPAARYGGGALPAAAFREGFPGRRPHGPPPGASLRRRNGAPRPPPRAPHVTQRIMTKARVTWARRPRPLRRGAGRPLGAGPVAAAAASGGPGAGSRPPVPGLSPPAVLRPACHRQAFTAQRPLPSACEVSDSPALPGVPSSPPRLPPPGVPHVSPRAATASQKVP